MRAGEPVFVDSSAWVGLALVRDPAHERACAAWEQIAAEGARVFTSVQMVIETFTFLQRNANLAVARTWRRSLTEVVGDRLLACTAEDLEAAWPYLDRRDLHKLSAADATSFALMKRHKIRHAFSFDHHFAMVGFHLVG